MSLSVGEGFCGKTKRKKTTQILYKASQTKVISPAQRCNPWWDGGPGPTGWCRSVVSFEIRARPKPWVSRRSLEGKKTMSSAVCGGGRAPNNMWLAQYSPADVYWTQLMNDFFVSLGCMSNRSSSICSNIGLIINSLTPRPWALEVFFPGEGQ